jgi:hypothetical protein
MGNNMSKNTKKYALEMKNIENERIICKEYNKKTIHSIISSYDENGDEVNYPNVYCWIIKDQIIQCQGCESVSFRTLSTNSEDSDYSDTGIYYYPTIKYYPARVIGFKSIDSNLLPSKIGKIYQETLFSIENEQNVLAGIGIRAIIETICKDLDAKGGKLSNKIDHLKKLGLITSDSTETLHKLRVLGNDAAHEVKAHNSTQLELAMQIIEHLLNGTYILKSKISKTFPEKK